MHMWWMSRPVTFHCPPVPFPSKSKGHVPQLLWERRPWSISCEITENIGRKVFPSTWNIGLNWYNPLLVSRRTPTLSALPDDVMSKIECGQLHIEDFGRRHSTLQSHGLFVLAKHLLYISCKTAYSRCPVCSSPATKRLSRLATDDQLIPWSNDMKTKPFIWLSTASPSTALQ